MLRFAMIAVAILCMLDIGDSYNRKRARRRRNGNGGSSGGSTSTTLCHEAQVYGFCVSQSVWNVSYDGGDTFETVWDPDVDGWSTMTDFTMGPITDDTIMEVTCKHTGPRMLSDNGLFIANVNCDNVDYYTSDPMSDSYWECTDSTGGYSTDITVYCPRGGTPGVQEECLAWDPTDTFDEANNINENAYWVWNDGSENTLTFQIDFGDVADDMAYAVEQSASEMELFERAHSVVDVMGKENSIHQGSVVVAAGAGVLMTMMLVAMFCIYRSPQKEEYQALV